MTGLAALAAGFLLIGGVALAVQAPINAGLGRAIGGTLPAAAVSFGVGCVALTTVALLGGQGAGFLALGRPAPWQLVGGLLGAFYVWAATWGVGHLGAVSVTGAVIGGQMLGALVLDTTGAFGLPVQELTPTRLLAVALVVGGLILSRL